MSYISTGKPRLSSESQRVAAQAVHIAAGNQSHGKGEMRKRRIRGREISKREHEIGQHER